MGRRGCRCGDRRWRRSESRRRAGWIGVPHRPFRRRSGSGRQRRRSAGRCRATAAVDWRATGRRGRGRRRSSRHWCRRERCRGHVTRRAGGSRAGPADVGPDAAPDRRGRVSPADVDRPAACGLLDPAVRRRDPRPGLGGDASLRGLPDDPFTGRPAGPASGRASWPVRSGSPRSPCSCCRRCSGSAAAADREAHRAPARRSPRPAPRSAGARAERAGLRHQAEGHALQGGEAIRRHARGAARGQPGHQEPGQDLDRSADRHPAPGRGTAALRRSRRRRRARARPGSERRPTSAGRC